MAFPIVLEALGVRDVSSKVYIISNIAHRAALPQISNTDADVPTILPQYRIIYPRTSKIEIESHHDGSQI